jgi:hypothetical protein
VVHEGLPAGDYSVQGLETSVTQARKRLAEIPHRAILAEATWEEIKSPYVDSAIPSSAHPDAIDGSLVAIQARWNIPIICLARDRALCEEWAASWLTKVATYAWLEAQGLSRVLQEGDL